ncbi:MAG: hypothetical protein ABEK10_02280 [Candidatus Nanosalina sp.]
MLDSGPNISIEGVSVDRRVLVSGNSSELDRALLNSVESNQTYLLRSDLQGLDDPERIIQAFRNRNASVYFLKGDIPLETSVSVKGPSVTVPGAGNTFTVDIESTESVKQKVTVTVDGEQKVSRQAADELSFNHRFENEGYHTIKARINSEDRYSANDVFYKTVKVIKKPEILLVGETGRLDSKLSNLYDVTQRSSLPEDLSKFYAIFLKKKIGGTAQLKPYLINGNGLMYTGDGSMDILPVSRSKDIRNETQNAKVAIVLDISVASGSCAESTCWTEESRDKASIKPSKKFAYNVIYNLPKATKVSIGGYNDKFYNFSAFKSLAFHRQELMNTVSRIQVKGSTLHNVGLEGAARKIGRQGNIVFLTDGEISGTGSTLGDRRKALQAASDLPPKVKLFPVYTGEGDIPQFLENLASRAGGTAYTREEFYRSVPLFQGGGGAEEVQALSIVDSSHFITSQLGILNTAVTDFDAVETRPSAELLVASTGGRPALSTWRYGLGRVASFSAGSSNLVNILSQEPGLVSRSASWVVGDPQRKENGTITVSSGRVGEAVVISSDQRVEGLTRKPGGGFVTRVRPNSTGFHEFRGRTFSYNYREEIQNLGVREDLAERLANATGGEVVSREDLGSLRSEAKVSRSEVVDRQSLSWVFLVAALLVFLFNVGYRKLNGLL